jgi:hypothetical protein
MFFCFWFLSNSFEVLVVCMDWVFVNPNRLDFKLTVCEGHLFSTVIFHINLYCFLGNLFRCLIGDGRFSPSLRC